MMSFTTLAIIPPSFTTGSVAFPQIGSIYPGTVAPTPPYGRTYPFGWIHPGTVAPPHQSGSVQPFVDNESPAQKVITYISDDHHAPDINPACFWSGQTNIRLLNSQGSVVNSTISAHAALVSFKESPAINCNSLEDIICKAGQKIPSSKFTHDEWNDISRALAKHVSGKAYALLGQDILPKSAWNTVEKPTLKSNVKVTSLEIWEIQNDNTNKKLT